MCTNKHRKTILESSHWRRQPIHFQSFSVMVLIELFASQFDHLAVLAGTLSRKAPHKDLCRHPKVFLDSTTIANSSSTTRCPSMCLTSRRI